MKQYLIVKGSKIKVAFTIFFSVAYLMASAQIPYVTLSRPEDKSITISILSPKSGNYIIKYGTNPGNYNKQTPVLMGTSDQPLRHVLADLEPDTRYYYVVQYTYTNTTANLLTPEYTFHTQRSAGKSFTFTVEADEHLYDKKGVSSIYNITLANQLSDKPDFMFSLGDTFGDDHTPEETTSQDMKQLHLDYIPYLAKITHSVPFFFCLGNHEGENGYYLNQHDGSNIGVYGTNWRKYYFPNPVPNDFYTGNSHEEEYGIGLPENYYAFTWGNVQFIVLDVYRHCDINEKPKNWEWTLGKDQYDWLKNTLESSNSKFKIVMAHHTRGQGRGGINTAKAFEWGGYSGDSGTNYQFDTNRPGWGVPIHQLMVNNGVNLYLQGHDHVYAKEELDGIIYQTMPMPSDSTYNLGYIANGGAFDGVVLNGTGHLRFEVDEDCIKVDYVKAFLPQDTLAGLGKNGEIGHSYTIGACTSSTSNEAKSTLNIFPNPADNIIYIRRSDLHTAPESVEIIDINAQILYSGLYPENATSHSIDVANFPAGMYIVKIKNKDTFSFHKLIIH